jgi:hypothetical protein
VGVVLLAAVRSAFDFHYSILPVAEAASCNSPGEAAVIHTALAGRKAGEEKVRHSSRRLHLRLAVGLRRMGRSGTPARGILVGDRCGP